MQNKYEMLNSVTDKDTKMLIAKIYDIYNRSKDYNIISETNFLSPNMISFLIENFQDKDISIKLYGGYNFAERVVACFVPKNMKENKTDYNIDILKITYNTKYSRELKHKDYLGSILGLSIKRELIGDIVLNEDCAYVFVCNTISDFIIDNLKKVGRTNIKINKISEEIELLVRTPEEFKTTLTSLRIDVFLSKIFNLSRSEIKEFFISGKVFINWVNSTDISKIVKEDDIITLRGYGRIKYLESTGTNKKGKIAITYLKY